MTAMTYTGRLTCTGWSFARMLLSVVVLVDLCLITTALALVPIGIGVLFLLLLVPKVALMAGAFRRIAGLTLGRQVPSRYRSTDGLDAVDRARTWVRDPMRWRDVAWTYACSTVGWTLDILVVALFLWPIFYFIYPFLYAVTPDGTFDVGLGFIPLDSLASAWIFAWLGMGVAFALWWLLAEPLTGLRSRLDEVVLSGSREAQLERRVAEVSESRSAELDHSAAELRRIERDLHDGAQARLVALGMSLGLADEMLAHDPEAAKKLLVEARETTTAALGDLRTVVRGIHPPVLADRGLGGAVQALALDMGIPVRTTVDIHGRLPDPIESAMYFGVAECLANIGKHSGATRAEVELTYDGRVVTAMVTDNGRGGAGVTPGSGLDGLRRRLAAFDGTIGVLSPSGGPTTIMLEVPCASSSVRTTPSSATGSPGS